MEENQPPQLTKKEKRQQRKQQASSERQRDLSLRRFKNYAITIVIIVAGGFGLYFWAQSSVPQGEDFSQAIPLMGDSHIAVGSQLPEYNSNPPTSGPHYEQTVRSGWREEPIIDQNIIHNLEHGDIWIAYQPDLAEAIKEELKQFAAAKVIITPREANDTDIALVAWGRLDSFNIENNTLPVERIKDFIKHYTNQGPEKVPGASGGI